MTRNFKIYIGGEWITGEMEIEFGEIPRYFGSCHLGGVKILSLSILEHSETDISVQTIINHLLDREREIMLDIREERKEQKWEGLLND